MQQKFLAIIKNGKPEFMSDYNKARFNDWCKENEGQKIQIKRVSSKVSDNRRGWYWAGIIPFVKKLSKNWEFLTDEQLHEVLKTEFNGFTILDKKGNKRKYPMPVANRDTDTDVFDEYVARIAEWVRTQYNLELPNPEDYKEQRDSAELIK